MTELGSVSGRSLAYSFLFLACARYLTTMSRTTIYKRPSIQYDGSLDVAGHSITSDIVPWSLRRIYSNSSVIPPHRLVFVELPAEYLLG